MAQKQVISFQPHDEAVVATILSNRLGQADAGKMQADVLAAAQQAPGQPVVLDMMNVEFMASLALGALVDLMRDLRKSGHRFILANLNMHARNTLTITRLDKLFEIRDSVEDALK